MTVRHLYFHIPFCHRICPYCAFYKHQPGNTDIAAFVRALLGDIDLALRHHDLRPETIFFGGGTPTFLSRHHLEPLLAGMADKLDFSRLEEWTFEANPATFGIDKARLLLAGGATRISLGVQSFDPADLTLLGRDHSPAQARESFDILREAGCDNLNIDLMFALPGQPLARWEDSLAAALALGPEHVSCYNLTYEEDTEFMRRFESGDYIQDNDHDALFFERAADLLGAAGYSHYEISNYARPGRESVHNRAYWRGHDYLGFGPSAVSTVGRRRWKNVSSTADYIARLASGGPPSSESEDLSDTDRANEAVALQLRTDEGLDLSRAPHLTERAFASLIDEDLVTATPGRLILTPKGKLVADAVAEHLFL